MGADAYRLSLLIHTGAVPDVGLSWAEKNLCDDVHPGYHLDKTAPKVL